MRFSYLATFGRPSDHCRLPRLLVASAGVATLLMPVACADGTRLPAAATSTTTADRATTVASSTPIVGSGTSLVISAAATGIALDRRLFGTNAPAWIGPQRLADPAFRQRTMDSGATVLRMPGGSWSSTYDWLGCEQGDAEHCYWTWAAKPSDYAAFLHATDLEGMWTVSFNGTAQEAAALVAYFNGAADDTRVIGLDRHGTDWGTVGKWASLRAAHGTVAPQPVRLWEIGNEVYGAKPAAGDECAQFGWEDVWTCDGNAYVNGDAEHDGFLAFSAAMKAVDPTIQVGAVGITGGQDQWTDFGHKVIEGAKGALDFYVVHDYGFNTSPPIDEVLARPLEAWPTLLDDARTALDQANPSSSVPIGVTEYNLFAFQDGDSEAMMSTALDAFYLADTIGEMAELGVPIANQWNLLNGASSAGSDYGMIDADTGQPHPQYYALALWSRIGEELLPIASGFDPRTSVDAFAGRSADGTINVLVLNKQSTEQAVDIRLDGSHGSFVASADEVTAAAMDARTVAWNGSTDFDSLASRAAASLGPVDGSGFAHTFPPLSLTLLHLDPTG